MNYKLLLNFAVLTGEIMLENGAETVRVEDTVSRILLTSKCEYAEVFATPTGIFASLDNSDIELMTIIRRTKKRSINLNRIALANSISRDFCDGKLTLEAAMYRIQQIKTEPEYTPWIIIASTGMVAGFFAIVFGGDVSDMGVSLLCGILFGLIQYSLSTLAISKFFIDILGGILCALIPFICVRFLAFGSHFDLIVISSIMPMVPGVAITNAIRDTLHGELLSGVARAMDAFIIASSVATGVGITLSILL